MGLCNTLDMVSVNTKFLWLLEYTLAPSFWKGIYQNMYKTLKNVYVLWTNISRNVPPKINQMYMYNHEELNHSLFKIENWKQKCKNRDLWKSLHTYY